MSSRKLSPKPSRVSALVAALALPGLLLAQVSLYEFSQSVQTYTEITDANGGYVLGTATWDPPLHNLRAYVDPAEPDGQITNAGYLAPAIGPGYPIGFDFTYNGDVFDVIGVAHGGWISFGKSSDGDEAVVCFTSDHSGGRPLSHSYWATPLDHDYQRNRVAVWGSSELRMQNESILLPPGLVSSLRVATVGTAPNRTCVIQWKDFRHNYSQDGNKLNFQIRLNESDNSVEFRYGPMIWSWISAAPQVGLGGRTNEDFNNRVVVYDEPEFIYDWNNTTAGTENTASCTVVSYQPGQPDGSGVPPVSGRSFKWTPSTCPPPAWPLNALSIYNSYAQFEWSPVPDALSYDFVVSSTPDPETPTPVAADNTPEASLYVEGLDSLTTYYVFVRTVCADGPGPWGSATQFRSAGGMVLECGAAPVNQVHCYAPVDHNTWYYTNSDGFSPIRVTFTDGLFTSGARFRVFNGPDTSSAVLWDSQTLNAVLPGQVFTTSGPSLTLKMMGHPTAGCTNTDFLRAIRWTLGCMDCTEPLVNFTMGEEDCEAQEYTVSVNVFSMGSATSLILQNNLGVAPLTVTTTGVYEVGPFEAGESVVITAANPANALCNKVSDPLENEPCPIVDCGPTWYTECSEPNEVETWLFEGGGEPIAVRFLPTYLGFDAGLHVHDGGTEVDPEFTLISGSTNNEVRISTNVDDRLLVWLDASQYAEYACSEGNSQPLEFVVACYEACTQPAATFTSTCIGQTQYNVTVNVTALGSTSSVTITNDGGAPEVTATAIGTYTVGPFTSATPVRINVEGANEICTWSSSVLNLDCTGVGIEEASPIGTLRVFPNPSTGEVRVVLPAGFGAGASLQVMDMAGRMVMQNVLNTTGEVALDLSRVPSGLYAISIADAGQRATGRVSVQH